MSFDSEGVENFIVPCMLPPDRRDMYETEPFKTMVLIYNAKHAEMSGQQLPVGTFHCLLSLCSKKWKLCSDDHLSYTDASFEVREQVRLALTLLNDKVIRASIWCTRNQLADMPLDLIFDIRNQLQSLSSTFELTSPDVFYMVCPHAVPEDQDICLMSVKENPDEKKTISGYIVFNCQMFQTSKEL